MKLKGIALWLCQAREYTQASALKTMEQSFVYGEIYWSTWRLLAISMSTVLIGVVQDRELSPLDWGQVKAVLEIAHSPRIPNSERENEGSKLQNFFNNCGRLMQWQAALSIPFSDCVLLE